MAPTDVHTMPAMAFVLVVDDDESTCDALQRLLTRMGYVFTTSLPSDAPAAAFSYEAASGGSEYWVGYHNFRVVTRYNRSTKYALAAHQLAQAIRGRYFETVASNAGSAAE